MAIGFQVAISAIVGYEYLTRHVAVLDATSKGYQRLDAYYLAKGEEPGCWWGAGLAGVNLSVGDPRVTAEQMRLLFGHGLDPTNGAKLGRAYRCSGPHPDRVRNPPRHPPRRLAAGAWRAGRGAAAQGCASRPTHHPGPGVVRDRPSRRVPGCAAGA